MLDARAIIRTRSGSYDVKQATADTLEREGLVSFHDNPRALFGSYRPVNGADLERIAARIEQLEGGNNGN